MVKEAKRLHFQIIYGTGRTNSKANLLLQQENYVAEGGKEYKELKPLLLPVKRWVGLSKGKTSGEDIILQKTTPGKASKASRNHQDGWLYGRPDNSKTRKAEGSNSESPTKALPTAVTTRRQLCVIKEDATALEVLVRPGKALTVKASPKKQA